MCLQRLLHCNDGTLEGLYDEQELGELRLAGERLCGFQAIKVMS